MRLFWPWLPHRYQACFPHSTFGHAEPEIGSVAQFVPIQCRQSPTRLSGAPALLPSNPSSWCRWRPWLPKCCFHCSWAHWHCHHSSMTFPHNKSRLAHCTVHVLAHCIWDIFFTLNVRQHETKMVTIIPFGMTSKADTRPAVKMVQDTITANKICYCTWLAAFELLYCPRSSLHSSPISPPALSPALVLPNFLGFMVADLDPSWPIGMSLSHVVFELVLLLRFSSPWCTGPWIRRCMSRPHLKARWEMTTSIWPSLRFRLLLSDGLQFDPY